MAGVDVIATDPRRHLDSVLLFIFHRVFKATTDPLLDAQILIKGQSIFVATPHLGCWVVYLCTSLFIFTAQSFQYLKSLDTLLAQSLVV